MAAHHSSGTTVDGIDYQDVLADLKNLNEQVKKIKDLESNAYQEYSSYATEFKKRRKQLKNMRTDAKTPEAKAKLREFHAYLDKIEKTRPIRTPYNQRPVEQQFF